MSDKPDVGKDLRAVGGFFKKLVGFTERAERVIDEAKREGPPERRTPVLDKRNEVIEAPPQNVCGVCGGDGYVGKAIKAPCPGCKAPKKR